MPRPPRLFLENVPQHVTQRGNNRQDVFFAPADGDAYLRLLRQAAERYGCAIHAYVLMTNHVHLLATPARTDSLPKTMRWVHSCYGQYINRTYDRTGGLWAGRYHAAFVDDDRYVLTCYRYIELNPVRAGLAEAPTEYRWSSCRHNAQGAADHLVTPHPVFADFIGPDGGDRAAYQALLAEGLSADQLKDARASTHARRYFGGESFRRRLDDHFGTAFDRPRGRPRQAELMPDESDN